jgi:hypothetical protein
MMQELGERAIDVVDFDITRHPFFEQIHSTTWNALEEKGVVKVLDTIGHTHRYLTGFGWLKGLEATGQIETPELKEKVGRLMRALKRVVKGRQGLGHAYPDAISKEAQVSEDFVYNVIESGLIERLFRRTGATWESKYKGKLIRIPETFGHDR